MFGIPIVIDPALDYEPRMTCSPEFVRVQTPELVASTNAWMLEFFETHSVIKIAEDPLTGRKTLFMGPKSWAKLPKTEQKCMPWEW